MSWLERQWQSRTPAAALLYPIALLFGAVSRLRRVLYGRGILRSERLPVAVIVVGNIAVGGTGKTPLVLWLCAWLRQRGYRPGIISRGYGGTAEAPQAVHADSDPGRCGDEAVLLAARSGCPVWVGRNRPAAGRALLRAHPECNVILSDDGLQHYALARDVEIALVDGARGHGNGWLLPAGPLRETPARLRNVDAVVVNGDACELPPVGTPRFGMELTGRSFCNLLNPDCRVGPEYFHGKSVHAIAGIGHPARFFRHLQQLGIAFSARAYPDHHAFRAEDVEHPGVDAIVMTEKDAVKCRRFATERCWALPVDAEVDAALGALVLRKLESR